ncbi:MAG: AI-2E family transporter [Alphaproteobacteria bacterium]
MTTQQRSLIWLGILGGLLLILWVLGDIMLPFVAGFVLAYFLDPVCDWLQRRGLSRVMATALVTIAFVLLAALVLALLVPMLYGQLADFLSRLPHYLDILHDRAAPLLHWVSESLGLGNDEAMGSAATSQIGDAAKFGGQLLGRVASSLGAAVGALSVVAITPIVTFYLLRDWDRIVTKIDSWLPRQHADTIREQARLADRALAGFVRGQFLVCIILGTFYAVALTVAGLDFGMIVGLVAGLISFIPYVGSLVGLVLSVGMAVVQFDDWTSVLIVAGIFFAGQAVEGNVLTPKLVGDRVNVPAVWIMFALLAGGSLFGFVGVLLAVPMAAVIGVAVRFALDRYLNSALYAGGSVHPDSDPRP